MVHYPVEHQGSYRQGIQAHSVLLGCTSEVVACYHQYVDPLAVMVEAAAACHHGQVVEAGTLKLVVAVTMKAG